MAKLLFLAGSARSGSINKKLAQHARDLAEKAGAQATFIDLKDYDMPIYDGDLEDAQGLPENTKKLKALFAEHDGFFIASPEYNSSFSPLLKNTLDWISRPDPDNKDEPPLLAYKGKVAALAAATPGALGGIRGLVPLRMMLGNIAVHVLPQQVAVSNGFSAFDDNGALTNDMQANMMNDLIKAFIETADKLNA